MLNKIRTLVLFGYLEFLDGFLISWMDEAQPDPLEAAVTGRFDHRDGTDASRAQIGARSSAIS